MRFIARLILFAGLLWATTGNAAFAQGVSINSALMSVNPGAAVGQAATDWTLNKDFYSGYGERLWGRLNTAPRGYGYSAYPYSAYPVNYLYGY